MAGRQSIRGGWLLMCYIAVRSYSGCELVACATRETVEETGKNVSHLQQVVLEATSPTVQAPESVLPLVRRERTNTSNFYKTGKVPKKSLFKSRYAISPVFPRAALFSERSRSNSAPEGSTLPLRRDLQYPTLSQSSAAGSPLIVSAQERPETTDESKQSPNNNGDHADASVEEPSPARSQQKHQTISPDPDQYDFIVVGCGAAGCPLASYLALKGEGRRVLVLERGLERTFEQAPRAMTIFSDGMAIADEAISQPYATRKGVRTHVATVMGGGTAIDLAIYVEETKEYFDFLNERYPAYKFQWPAIQQAYRYVRKVVAHKMPRDTSFGHEYGRALRARGFHPLGGREPPEYSSSIQVNKVWGSYSLFDVPKGGYRRAADVFLSELPPWAKKNVEVRTRHVVERIEFDTTQRPPRAKCAVYRPTSYADIKPQGINFGQTLPSSSAGHNTNISLPQQDVDDACTHANTLSACWCHRSQKQSTGIGPLQQLNEIGAPVLVENPHVGQQFSDRVFIPVSAFTANYADEVTPLPSKPIRRMASLVGARKQDKSNDPPAASSTRRHALREDRSSSGGTFLSRVSESVPSGVARASARTKRVFGTEVATELSDGAPEKNKPPSGDRGSRRAEVHYRRTLSPSPGSSPITTLSREIPEEGELPVPRSGPEGFSAHPATPHTPTTLEGSLVTESGDSASQEGDPSRVVLVDFKNSLSSEITGRFVDVRYPQEGLLGPPRVCQAMGLKKGGPPDGCSAEHYTIGKRTLTCSLLVAEETSGGRAQEGAVLSTRFVFPPALRNDPFVDVVFEILSACGDYKQPFGLPVFQPLCAIVMPIIKCFRKALASFHFIAEPKSRGFVRLRSDGAVEVEGNYLKEEQDLFDAVRGVSSLVAIINEDTYRGILQPTGSASCPATVLNGLLDLFLTVASSTSLFLNRTGNFALIQNYLQDMLPERHRRLRRIIVLDKGVKPRKLVATAVDGMDGLDAYYQDGQEKPNEFMLEDYQDSVIQNVDEDKLEELGYKRKLEKIGFDFESYRHHTMAKGSRPPGSKEESPRWFAARRVLQEMNPEEESDPAVKRKMHSTVLAAPVSEPKANFTKQQLEDAENACRTPCTAVTGEGACAAADICCAAFGNSMCIRTAQNEELERQLRDELHKARYQTHGSTNDTNIRPTGTADTSSSGDASDLCAGGDESCVLRSVHRNGLLPTAVDEVWGMVERLPAAGASLLNSFLQGTTSVGSKSDGDGVHSSSRPSLTTTATETAALPGSMQWAATFPPRLPDPYNPKDVARYVLTHMSSVWHHCNTAPTGLVVNSDFEVSGTKGLSIVDASVLNQMTRMNPLATLLMLGTYAAMTKLRKAGVVDVMPPPDPLGNAQLASVLQLYQE